MASELLENTIATLRVLRTSDHGAFLDGQTGNTNDDISCFYLDFFINLLH